jgi:DNA primase
MKTRAAALCAAKAVLIENDLARRGVKLKREGRELVGPCPVCGGTDRFSVSINKQVWNCRGCSKGGDVIALMMHLDGSTFLAAIGNTDR